MKITGVRWQLYEIELTRPLGDANFPHGNTHMAQSALMLDTDEGVSGVSFGGGETVQRLVNELLVGRDPRGVRGHWKRMVDAVFKGNNRGVVTGAIAAIDVALWDLKAKLSGEPLWRTLGASSRRVRAYASDIGLNLNDDVLRAFYAGMAAKGVFAGKVKVGLDQAMDLRRIGIMRDALATNPLGKTPVLAVDSNEYWSPKQAIRHISEFERHFDLTWVEEPARRWDYRGLRQVSRAVRAAVATGENLNDISEFMPLIDNEAVDVVQFNHGVSGITGALMTADLAYGFELPVAMMNCPASFMAHLAAALPNHLMMEVLDAGIEQGLIHRHTLQDGCIVLSDDPGLGIAFDQDFLASHAAGRSSAKVRMPFPRRRGAGLYQVGPNDPEDLEEI